MFGTGTGSSTDFSLARASGNPIICDELTGCRDKAKHTITFVTPTSCLSSPRWLKAGVGVVVGSSTMYADDALRAGGGADESNLALSRKIHRG